MNESYLKSDLQQAEDEFVNLKILVDMYNDKKNDLIPGVNPEWVLKGNIANTLNSVYTGIERIFESILKETDFYHPTGSAYHKELLIRASTPVQNGRCELISQELKDLCIHLLGFRHLVRKRYSTSVNLDLALANVERASLVLPMLRKDLEHFFQVWRETTGIGLICKQCNVVPCICAGDESVPASSRPTYR